MQIHVKSEYSFGTKKVCLVFGAGRGIGATVAEKFAAEGFHSHLCRRTDENALKESIEKIQSNGGSASGELINAIDNSIDVFFIHMHLLSASGQRNIMP